MLVTEFRNGQKLYSIENDFFGTVTDLFLGLFWLFDEDNDLKPFGYFCRVEEKFVELIEDTPQNRLAIRLKYSL